MHIKMMYNITIYKNVFQYQRAKFNREKLPFLLHQLMGFPSDSVKNPPAMQETWVQSLGQEDPLEQKMAPHSGILAWKIPWIEESGGLQSTGLQRVGHD